MNIYLAGPLFNDAEKLFNLSLTDELENLGFTVYLPQRDGVSKQKRKFKALSKEERRSLIFHSNRDQIYKADIFLMILDGRVPDEGACVELGIAYAQVDLMKKNKKLIGLQTDNRAAFLEARLNPMLKVSLQHVFQKTEDLISYLRELNSQKGDKFEY